MSNKHTIIFVLCSLISIGFGQFGQNIVQYDDFTWHFIQSKHFDIYYSENGRSHAEFTAEEAEIAYLKISDRLNWQYGRLFPYSCPCPSELHIALHS